MEQIRHDVVAVMLSWLGFSEANGKHRQIIDLYNTQSPLPRGYKVRYSDEWCAATVSAVAVKLGITDIMPTECSCNEMIRKYQAMGRWEENDGYLPSPGDIIMYDWQDGGSGDDRGAADHVGIVERVVGGSITVIEGNKGEAVARRTLAVNGRYIRGYCLPDYASKEDEEMTQEQFNQMFEKAMEAYNQKLSKMSPSPTHAKAWRKAKSAGVLDGSKPKGPLTREQAATVLDRLKLLEK